MARIPPFDRENKNPKFKKLVAKLKKDPSVKDPEALAYTIGLRKMRGGGGSSESPKEGGGSEPFWKKGWERIKTGAKKIRTAFDAETYKPKKKSGKGENFYCVTANALEEMVEGFDTLEG